MYGDFEMVLRDVAYPRRIESRKENEGICNPIAHTTMGELKRSPTNAKFWNINILHIFQMLRYNQCTCVCMNNILSTFKMHAKACVLAK